MGAVCLPDVFSELRLRVEKDKPACLYAYLAEVAKERTNVRTMSETDQACLLCDAAKSGKVAKVADLLERGVPPDASDYDKRAALHIAAEEGFLDIVRLLVERGATVDAHDRWGTTPHAGAVQKGHTDVSGYLRSQGAKQPRVACSEEEGAGMLCAAAGKGNLAKMRSILDSGVCADAADYDFRIALHLAAEEGRLEACRFLLERGCDVNAQDRWGTTPLSGAENNDHAEVAAFLRAEGGKRTGELVVRRRSSLLVPQHQSELIKAAAQGDVAVVRKLLENGADPLASDYDRRCPLHLAAEEGHLEAVKVLLAAGANIDAKDRWGSTPLKGAIRNTHGDVANFLKDHGARTDKFAEHRTYAGNQRLAKNFFNGILGASAFPATELLPMTALVTRLQGDHGFQVADHPVLREELARISRRPDEAAAAAYLAEHADVREALEEHRGHFTSCFGADVFFAADFADLVLHVHAEHERQGTVDLPEKARLVSDIVLDRLEVKNWTAFCSNLRTLFEEVLAGPNDGNNADYIPELKFAPSDRFAVSVCTVHGQRVNLGDTDSFFSMQSVSKAFAYTRALKIHGKEFVHRHVGQEPSGRAFNDFALTRQNTPFNPVTNAGAIVTASMLESDVADVEERLKPYKKFVGDMAGGVEIGDCMDVYHSEQDCAFRNYALANFMMAEGTFPKDIDTHEKIAHSVQFYLRLCSSKVSASILASVASTYANFGTSPLTGQHLVAESDVKQTLQILYSCGMYDYSGEWACTIGMPAKSGVSGEIFVVVPGVLGLCVWSPKLDQCGNSVRSIRLCQKFAQKFRLSVLDVLFRQKDTGE